MADQWNTFWRGHLPQHQQQAQVNRQYEHWQGQQTVQSPSPRPLMKCNIQYPFQPRQSLRNNIPNRTPTPRPLNRNYSARNVHPPAIDQSRLAGFEAEKRFTNSKERIHNVLQNATKTHHKLNYRYQRVNSQVWKATVGVPWPSSYFEVTGEGFDKKQAERRAAALALLRLEEMGFPVGSTGTSILSKKEEINRDDEPEEIQIPECVMSRIEPLLDVSKLTMEKITSKSQSTLSNRAYDQQSPDSPHQKCSPPQSSTPYCIKDVQDIFTGSALIKQEDTEKLNKTLLKELTDMQKINNLEMQRIRETTHNLPATKLRKEITDLIKSNQVVLISGETGCGKTTQVPQFVLDNAIKNEEGSLCNIVVTQPRRIVAMSIAERVAKERSQELGKSIGYQVRLESKLATRPGRILFCTTGVLLRKIQSNPQLIGVSHVIVDEVHERDINTDFLLVLLKDMIDTCPSLKIVIMSATVDSHRFCEFFLNCPQLNISGFTHPVTEYFLDELKQMLPPKPGQEQQWLPGNQDSKRFKLANDVNAEVKVLPDVDPHLATDVILHVARTYQEGAILCFLSGWDEIMTVYDLLLEKIPEHQKSCYSVLPLHSMLPLANQNQVFERPPAGIRKIILATNIAETSITINDITHVINAGNVKEKTYDEQKKVSCLGTHWCSKASVTQRRGRAGRCKPGYCFNLFTRKEFEEMESYQKPEMLRISLEEVVLQSKVQRPDCSASQFLGKALDPPSAQSVKNAVELLQDIGAFDDKETLTILGQHMANLPVDPKIAKMIIYATVFRCVDPVLTIAAALSYRDPFLTPVKKRAEADKSRVSFARGLDSDHVALLNAYEGWVESLWTGNEREYINKNFLHRGTLTMIQGMRNQLFHILAEARLVPNDDTNLVTNMYSRNLGLVRAVLCAGLYPNVIKVGLGLESKGRCGKKRLKTTLRTKNDGRVAIHPSSVNVDKKNFNTKWLIYYEKVKSTQVFIRDSSTIHPVALLLFAGNNLETLETPSQSSQSSHVTLAVDGDRWMGFLCAPRAANTLQSLRVALENMVNQTMDTTRSHEVFEFNTKLIESVTTLLDRTYHTRVNHDKR